MGFPCPAAMLAGTLAASVIPLPAQAQPDAPRSKSLVSDSARRLGITQSEAGFSIQPTGLPPERPKARRGVRLGSSLILDRELFERTSLIPPENKHAAHQ